MSGPYRCGDCGTPLAHASPPLCDRCLDARCCPHCRIGGDLFQDWATGLFVHPGCLTQALEEAGWPAERAQAAARDRLGRASTPANPTATVEHQMRTEIGLFITALEARTFHPGDHQGP